MAIIKCPNCGKMVSDSNKRCSECDGDLVLTKYACADCGSTNIKLDKSANNGMDSHVKSYLLFGLWGIIGSFLLSGEKKRSLKEKGMHYICNDCGSRFRIRPDSKNNK